MEYPLTFAIGDIHGCLDKLQALLAACDRTRNGREARYVLLGDYIDRGPNSRGVVDFLIHAQRGAQPTHLVCLRGNHEQMLVDAAARGRSMADLKDWLGNGGGETLDSYGVNDPAALPESHLEWIRSLPLSFSDSKRHYVHAGIRPDVALADQLADDLLWIREPFLSSDARHPSFIVHGHTPTFSGLPDLRAHRLNLDTGACFGGELTAAAFTDEAAHPVLFVNSLGATWQP